MHSSRNASLQPYTVTDANALTGGERSRMITTWNKPCSDVDVQTGVQLYVQYVEVAVHPAVVVYHWSGIISPTGTARAVQYTTQYSLSSSQLTALTQ